MNMMVNLRKYTFSKFVIPSSLRGKTKGELKEHFQKSSKEIRDNQIVAVKRAGNKLPSKLHLSRLSAVPDSAVFVGSVSARRWTLRGYESITIPLFERPPKP
ncbi:MAG: hypothetical protein AAGB32_04105 [Pseudomonadota bacterium]